MITMYTEYYALCTLFFINSNTHYIMGAYGCYCTLMSE